jgi:ankyrin repeat protein
MSSRSLPVRPNLHQLKIQANELRRQHREGKKSAAARISANLQSMTGKPAGEVLAVRLSVADAQAIIAREYGFRNWARLKQHVETASRVARFKSHPRFDDAVAAMDRGDLEGLRKLLEDEPALIRARTNLDPPYHYFTGATLLHHIAGNPSRGRLSGELGPMPKNSVDIARLLLDQGSDVNASTLGRNGGTTMGLLVTSKQASDANLSGPLMALLLEYGARLDIERADALDQSLANHAPRAAEKIIELGAKPDVLAAAALGRMDLLRAAFDKRGRLRMSPYRGGRKMAARDAIGLAMLFAYVREQREAVEFLLSHDGNWDMIGVNNGTALHRAAWGGDLAMVQRLWKLGADISNRDNPFTSTPLSWAQHNKQDKVFQWMRRHCQIDLHDAVGFGLMEHVKARLKEHPGSVNALRDQWDIPQCAPLHWACWLTIDDVDGTHAHDPADREALVKLLLKNGADPNIVAGNGLAPLDVALAAGAKRIASLLEQHGGKRAAEL